MALVLPIAFPLDRDECCFRGLAPEKVETSIESERPEKNRHNDGERNVLPQLIGSPCQATSDIADDAEKRHTEEHEV